MIRLTIGFSAEDDVFHHPPTCFAHRHDTLRMFVCFVPIDLPETHFEYGPSVLTGDPPLHFETRWSVLETGKTVALDMRWLGARMFDDHPVAFKRSRSHSLAQSRGQPSTVRRHRFPPGNSRLFSFNMSLKKTLYRPFRGRGATLLTRQLCEPGDGIALGRIEIAGRWRRWRRRRQWIRCHVHPGVGLRRFGFCRLSAASGQQKDQRDERDYREPKTASSVVAHTATGALMAGCGS